MEASIQNIIDLESYFKDYIKSLEKRLGGFLLTAILLAGCGCLILFIVVGLIGYLYFNNQKIEIMYFLPFSGIVISLELLGYFFLKSYMETGVKIKYFQNELINLGLKKTALNIYIEYRPAESLGGIINVLINTERNHILKEGESSVELKQMELVSKYNSSIKELINLNASIKS